MKTIILFLGLFLTINLVGSFVHAQDTDSGNDKEEIYSDDSDDMPMEAEDFDYDLESDLERKVEAQRSKKQKKSSKKK